MKDRVRPAALGLLAFGGAAITAAVPTGAPPPSFTSADALARWWETDGPGAALLILRAIVIAGCAYVAVLAALLLIADALRFDGLRAATLRLTPPELRRHLAAGVLVVAVASSAPAAHAQESNTAPPILLVDIGPADTPPEHASLDAISLTDLGPAAERSTDTAATPAAGARAPESFGAWPGPTRAAPSADAWLVEPGDHLWGIAATVVAASGRAADQAAVTVYWLQLIDANASLLEANPDLIYPGQVLSLPGVAQG